MSRKLGSILGAALCALVFAAPVPADAHTVRHDFDLDVRNVAGLAGTAWGTIWFDSQTQARVNGGYVSDVDYDGWCALVSITVNDGYAGAYTTRREACGVMTSTKIDVTLSNRRVYNVKVAVGRRYPPTGQVRWGESVKYWNPHW